jgi:hypothetical protein
MTIGELGTSHSEGSSSSQVFTADTVRPSRPLRLWLIVALQAVLMLGMTVLYPAFQNPDEAAHTDYVLAHRQGEWFDGPGERQFQSGVPAASAKVPATQFRLHVGGQPTVRSQRGSFDALGTDPVNSPLTNQMVQHPPLYYGLAAGFSYLMPRFSHQSFDRQVFWLRLFSIVLLLPVPLLIFGAARRISRDENLALFAALIPLSIPSYLRTGASITNDSLLLLLTTLTMALLVRVVWGDLSRRTAVLVGLTWGGALLTKGFALTLPPAIVVAYLVGSSGPLVQRIRTSLVPMVTAGAVGALLGGWWWARNVLVYGTVQPQGLGKIPDSLRAQVLGRDWPGGGEVDFFGNFFRLLGQRTWGSLGLIDQPSLAHPPLQAMAVAFALSLVTAVCIGTRRLRVRLPGAASSGWTAGRAAALILPALLTVAVMYFGARGIYLRGRQLPGIQVRYVLPTVLGLTVCAAASVYWISGRFARWLPPSMLTGGLAFIALSVHQVLDLEMSSRSDDYRTRMKDALHFVVGWAPFPTAVAAALLCLIAAVAATALVSFWWTPCRQRAHV